MPEVPPVIKIVLECIFMSSSPIIRDDRFTSMPMIAGDDSTAPQIRIEQIMTRFLCSAVFLFVCFTAPLLAQLAARRAGDSYQFKRYQRTIAWGYYDAKPPP